MSPEAVPARDESALAWLEVDEMRAVDEIMISDLGIGLELMMENAGRSLAVLARLLLGGSAAGRLVTVLAGPGGNGGGGLVAARHLLGAGADVRVVIASEHAQPVTRAQLDRVHALGIPIATRPSGLGEADLVVDALLGYSQSGAPRGAVRAAIVAAADSRVLSLDAPSGLELARAVAHTPSIRAAATLTLAAPKSALRVAAGVGDLYLADIGVPPAVFERIGRSHPTPFGEGPLIRIRRVSESREAAPTSNVTPTRPRRDGA